MTPPSYLSRGCRYSQDRNVSVTSGYGCDLRNLKWDAFYLSTRISPLESYNSEEKQYVYFKKYWVFEFLEDFRLSRINYSHAKTKAVS